MYFAFKSFFFFFFLTAASPVGSRGSGWGCWSLSQLRTVATAEGREHQDIRCKALFEHLAAGRLAQGYLGIALKVSWHLLC